MTVHSSKGLEFDCVFISGLEDGIFPHENSLSDAGGIEEERRLMYVAITRARKRLYLSYCQTRMLHGQTRYNLKSRFFDELPEGALKWITPNNRSGRSGAWRDGAHSGGGRKDWASNVFASKAGQPERFASPPVPAQRSEPAHGLKSGMNVFHAKFGEGRVMLLEGHRRRCQSTDQLHAARCEVACALRGQADDCLKLLTCNAIKSVAGHARIYWAAVTFWH